MRVQQMTAARYISHEELEAMLWQKHLDDHLIVCSFAKVSNPLRYIGFMKGGGKWRSKVLDSRESLSRELMRAKNSRNGSYAITLVRRASQAEKFSEGGVLTEQEAFGSYVQLIEFVGGGSVIYGEKNIDQRDAER